MDLIEMVVIVHGRETCSGEGGVEWVALIHKRVGLKWAETTTSISKAWMIDENKWEKIFKIYFNRSWKILYEIR